MLKFFGFSNTFCSWIQTILVFAYLSISFNEAIHGYFNCSSGVMQGDVYDMLSMEGRVSTKLTPRMINILRLKAHEYSIIN